MSDYFYQLATCSYVAMLSAIVIPCSIRRRECIYIHIVRFKRDIIHINDETKTTLSMYIFLQLTQAQTCPANKVSILHVIMQKEKNVSYLCKQGVILLSKFYMHLICIRTIKKFNIS